MSNPVLCSSTALKAIQGKLDAGEKPTPEIISYILKDQTSKAQGLLRKDSSLICHAICVNAFSTVGWAFDQNARCAWWGGIDPSIGVD